MLNCVKRRIVFRFSAVIVYAIIFYALVFRVFLPRQGDNNTSLTSFFNLSEGISLNGIEQIGSNNRILHAENSWNITLEPKLLTTSAAGYDVTSSVDLSTSTTSPSTKSATSPTYVVILSYQRSGSTFLGQLFNQNPDAFYQYEPLDSLYSSIFATPFGWTVPSDIFFNKDGSKRHVPQWELDEVSKFLKQLLTCNYDALPTETLIHPFQTRSPGEFLSTATYIDCLVKNVSAMCYQSLQNYCGIRFNQLPQHRLEDCKRLMKNRDDTSVSLSLYQRRRFQQYSDCKQQLRGRVVSRCRHHYIDACTPKQLRAVKVVRARMSSMESLLSDADMPNFRVIHLVRDPRGVALSRINTHDSMVGQYARTAAWHDKNEMITREARLYCQTAVEDIKTRRELELRYPGRIMTVVYENLVADIDGAVQKINDFIGLASSSDAGATAPMPVRLNTTVVKTIKMMSSQVRGFGRYHAPSSRSNRYARTFEVGTLTVSGIDIALQWRTALRPEDRVKIFNDCAEFYQNVEYNWLP